MRAPFAARERVNPMLRIARATVGAVRRLAQLDSPAQAALITP